MIRKIIGIITVAAFVLIAFFPVYGLLMPGANSALESENRGKKEFSADVPIGELPSAVEEYFNDSFAFRSELVSLNNDINNHFGGSTTDRAIEGLNGWFYYMDEGSREDILRTVTHTQEEIDAICKTQQATSDYLESRGIEYYLMVCPDKHTVYPEYLPMNMRVQEGSSRLDPLAEALKANTTVNFVDTREAVIAAKDENELFFKTDTHWNAHAAFIGYSMLAEQIEKDVPGFVNIKAEDCDITTESWIFGDLTQMIGRTGEIEDMLVKYTPKGAAAVFLEDQTLYGNVSPHSDQISRVYENPNYPDGPVCVVFRDSFCNEMIPLLNESGFSRIVYIWTREALIDVIEEEDPDVVISEYVERFSSCMANGLDAVEEKVVDYAAGERELPSIHEGLRVWLEQSWHSKPDIGFVRGELNLRGYVPAQRGSFQVALKKGEEIVWCPTVSTVRYAGNASDFLCYTATYDKRELSPGSWEMIIVFDDGKTVPGYNYLGKTITVK